MGRNAVASLAALAAVILLCVAGVYLYRQTLPMQQGEGSKSAGGTAALSPAPAPPPAGPQAAAPRPAPQGEAASAPPEEAMVVPSFDVLLVEPSGEGVFAGRSGPGWTVELQSRGMKLAETMADGQGEWNIILDKKLAPGDYLLQLRTISPDGTRALTSQQTVPVAVGKPTEQVAAAPQSAPAASPAPQVSAPAKETSGVSTDAPKPQEQLAGASPQQPSTASQQTTASLGSPEEKPAKPVLTFKTVDYQDTGADSGKMKLSGTSAPGATVQLYFDGKPFATAKADAAGQWQAESEMKLGEGAHSVTAAPAGAGGAAEQALISLERMPAVVKAPEPQPASPQVAAAEEANGAASAANTQGAAKPDIYEIRRGDTLWDIAKRYLGSGFRYTSIFEGNRETIRNPNLILPAQKVKMPPS